VALGVLLALGSAIFYGVGAVLQAKAAAPSSGPDSSSFWRLLIRGSFVAGVVLDVAGFAAQFGALRLTPVFLVQAAQAASLAVTAGVAVLLLGTRLGGREWAALAAVCAGLAALGVAAGPERATHAGLEFRWGLVAAMVLLGAAGLTAARFGRSMAAAVLGLVAGLGFGVVALATRSLPALTPYALIRDPASYALALGGIAAFLFYARGLQAGAVTTVTAATVAGETLLPAIVGILAFGDHTRPGFAPLAVAGFVATLAGAIGLARFGTVEPVTGDERPA
jgi:drug/metabolite transporter (DMT)-like permease